MNEIQSSICDHLEDEFDGKLLNLQRKQENITSILNSISTELSNITPSDPTSFSNQISNAQNNAINMIPNLNTTEGKTTALNEISTMISSCLYMKNDKVLSNPNTMLTVLTKKFLNLMTNNTFGSISTTDYPELGTSLKINDLMNKFKDMNLNKEIPNMDQLLNCLSTVCGRDVQSRINSMNNATDSMYIDENGNFNEDQYYINNGIDQDTVNNMKIATNSISSTNKTAQNIFNTATGIIS